ARHRDSRGQGLVEFALVIPVFLMMLTGVVDGGRAIFAFNQMSQVTRAVARVASTTCFQVNPACDKSSGAIAASIASQSAGLQGPTTWTVECINPTTRAVPTNSLGDFCKVGYVVRVSVSSSFSLVTPIASSFGPVQVGSKSEQEILQ
ncbi:MAG: TadE/TadG family type IV pilus assembly protein, partial [Chloroflexota bacterium]